MIKIHIFVLVVLTSTINCEFGIDLSTLTSVDSFKCFLSNYTFLNVRAWRSYGAFDPNSVQTLANAKQAGFHVDNIGVYMFPCSFGKPAADQVK